MSQVSVLSYNGSLYASLVADPAVIQKARRKDSSTSPKRGMQISKKRAVAMALCPLGFTGNPKNNFFSRLSAAPTVDSTSILKRHFPVLNQQVGLSETLLSGFHHSSLLLGGFPSPTQGPFLVSPVFA